ncbi:MAG: ribosome biogenesis GTPase Der [Candidatus Omnitrophica bacterium 4484_49]|nr:MAG: ribosome biogenesis GTPase Der [Candidatus Omnitrophica bacterium 4484_49]
MDDSGIYDCPGYYWLSDQGNPSLSGLKMAYFKVAIVGRPNVGKSTLFNRIVGKRVSIIEESKGVTRDKLYKKAEWLGKEFIVIDTGGIIEGKNVDMIYRKVREQSLKAIEESDFIIFLTDVTEGVHPLDEEIANLLRKKNKDYLLAVNKVDNSRREMELGEFTRLGGEDVIGISALHGRFVDLVLDRICEYIGSRTPLSQEELPKIAIVGRPNVGKSSFVNAIVGEERVVVDHRPGTTRDAVDTQVEIDSHKCILIDTAGIRKKAKIKSPVDYFSSVRTQSAIDESHVVLFMIDGWEGIRHDDLYYIYRIWEKGKGMVLVINKRDLIQRPIPEYEKLIIQRLPLARYLPVVYTSAIKGYNITQTLLAGLEVYKNLHFRIKTSELNRFLQMLPEKKFPRKGRRILKIYYGTQTGVNPPQFVFVSNYPQLVTKNFSSFIDRSLRSRFGFSGVPLRLRFKSREGEGRKK